MDVQRGELTCAALGEKAVHVPSAFGVLPVAAGKAQGGGKLPWKKSSEVSFHRDMGFSKGERVSVSLCALYGPILSGCLLRGSAGDWDHSHCGHWC